MLFWGLRLIVNRFAHGAMRIGGLLLPHRRATPRRSHASFSELSFSPMQLATPFLVIDLFAGPGGLGEGFSSYCVGRSRAGFSVRLSIEMDPVAHQTLLLRKFFRSFEQPTDDYFDYVAGQLTREELFARHSTHYDVARKQAWQVELGRKRQSVVTRRIDQALNGASAWALIGGPPCQAYSLAGRSRMQSRSNPDFESDHRHFLYRGNTAATSTPGSASPQPHGRPGQSDGSSAPNGSAAWRLPA
jgi:hypothetical protein